VVVPFVQPKKDRHYTPDFELRFGNRAILVETKGKLTFEDRQKLVWVKEQHPKKKFVILFMNSDVRIRKNSPTTYSKWAEKAGFEYYDFRRGLPEEWQRHEDKL
jgi:hypothetical protein